MYSSPVPGPYPNTHLIARGSDSIEEPGPLTPPTAPDVRDVPWIDEAFYQIAVPPWRMDQLWSEGWRHFGPLFVRYSLSQENGLPQVVQPLRVDLTRCMLSKSQRRTLQRNKDLRVSIQPPALDEVRHLLFERHKARFTNNIPRSLHDFLGGNPSAGPCETVEVGVYDGNTLVAASYLDVGSEGTSSIYGMFHPELHHRALGIYTMLLEMDYSRSRGCRYYYPGYAFHHPSLFDYKKQFNGLQWLDWTCGWRDLPRLSDLQK